MVMMMGHVIFVDIHGIISIIIIIIVVSVSLSAHYIHNMQIIWWLQSALV